jgi:hypothetical protein
LQRVILNHANESSQIESALAKLVQGEWVKFNRPGEALMQVEQISERHAEVIGEALQKWLPAVDIGQKNIFYVLEVLVEAQATSEASLSPQAKEALQRLEGSGKAAKLAKKLLRD